ncbi:DEAD-box ATP-dependent RNA helicase 38-like isoform X2 [Euphorbia lathyris]|uniref:DEAD-box ATP-dependent RNA helicase 38-like isoform X2 n=1 Tax=Euphorbia lathyris TaxID=212925 RepID=UPI0033136F21
MEVGNMLRLKEGFEYKSLARRQDTKLEKLIAEHELLKKVAQEEINNLQRQLAQSKNSEAVRNTEIINLRKMLEHEVCQKETLEREISILQIQPLQTNLDADEVTSGDTPYSSAATFEDLNLSLELLKGLYVEMKFQKPSKIQAISLPMILTPPYKDLIAQAHNGSGKATCFVLGMLSRVDPNLKRTQALCICPTRELTIQDGFQDDSLKIMKDIERGNARCQVLLFSATFDETVKKFVARTVKNDHNQLFVKKEELSLNSVKQYKVTCLDEVAKILVVKEKILEFGQKMGQAIIFVNSKRSAAMLHETLTVIGYEVTTIHGALNTEDRDKIVKEFKDGLTQVLISTDLLARGFDQQQVNVVVNYDLPVKFENPSEPNYEVYLHRIGRAGRFGRKGAVFSFVMDYSDQMIMDKIDQYFGMKTIEVPPSNSEEDFKVAMKAAGLM